MVPAHRHGGRARLRGGVVTGVAYAVLTFLDARYLSGSALLIGGIVDVLIGLVPGVFAIA